MPVISKELNWLRRGYVSMFSRGNFGKSDQKVDMEDQSWRTWKSNQNVVMVQNIVMDQEVSRWAKNS